MRLNTSIPQPGTVLTAQDATQGSQWCPAVRHHGAMDLSFDRARLARAIVATRDALDWSQPQLARAAGISVTTIQRLELTAGDNARYPSRRSVFAHVERAFRWPVDHCLAIGEGRIRIEDVVAEAVPTAPRAATASPTSAHEGEAVGEDEFVRDLMGRPISKEVREAIVDAYLAEKAKDDERRRREDEERRQRFLRIADLGTSPTE